MATYVHDSWTRDVNGGYDIAVIKLDRKANITLPAFDRQGGEFRNGRLFTALGWGGTQTGAFPNRLKMAENLVYLPPLSCRERFGYKIDEQMVCAGLMNEDTCKGETYLSSIRLCLKLRSSSFR